MAAHFLLNAAEMPTHHLNWPQTIGVLYGAAREAGWSVSELAGLLRAHNAIEPLFAGWRRASGRCFTAHLAGTAGLALEFGASRDEVIAALAHAVFDEGAFGRAGGRHRGEALAALSDAVSPEAVSLVAGYSEFSWPRFIAAVETDAHKALAGVGPRLVRLRIVNEIDDALDWPFFTEASRASGMRECAVAEKAARALGWDALAGRAAFVAAEMAKAPIVSAPPRDAAYFVQPRGYLLPFTERLRGRIAREFRRLTQR